MFYRNRKNTAIIELEKAQNEYNENNELVTQAANELYLKRKEILALVEKAENKLTSLPDFNINNLREISIAKSGIRLFVDTVNKESKHYENASEDLAVPFAFATILGTSFGRVTTIHSLLKISSIPLLGSSALSGGLLALTGPLGIAVGGITALGCWYSTKKNKQIVNDTEKALSEMKKINEKLEKVHNKIKSLQDEIDKNRKILSRYYDKDELSEEDYTKIVEIIKSICNNISYKIDL